MTANSLVQVLIFYALLTLLSVPLGKLMVRFFNQHEGSRGNYPTMTWREYSFALIYFSLISLATLTLVLKFQNFLPYNQANLPGLSWALAVNTAVSFVTNTNWQAYGGETTLSIFSQTLGLAVQNFLSAAVGLCVLAVLCRGLIYREQYSIGNFWYDLKNFSLKFLLPISFCTAVLLIAGGVPQTLSSTQPYTPVEASSVEQTIPTGMVASQIAIKQLGTNGGGYFNVNSAHPLENPSPFTNLIELLAILLIPAACCHAFGYFIKDLRQGWALYAVMAFVAVASTLLVISFEQNPNPKYFADAVSLQASAEQSGGNMEGKETRFGVTNSALWAVATTAASNGSVNAMHDSFTPLGGLVPLLLMQLGEVIFGGVGSGLYGMLAFVIVTVFIAGLMVGRTPEYLGKKIDVFEMKMVSLVVLIPCLLVLVGSAFTIALGYGSSSVSNPGPHGFSQILYAYSSMGNNNGSAFGGFAASAPIHLWMGAVIMFLSRYLIILCILALAGSLAAKRYTPVTTGTLPTHTVLFNCLLLAVILIVGALTFIPALVLGPIIEQLI